MSGLTFKMVLDMVGNVSTKANEYGGAVERFANRARTAANKASNATSSIFRNSLGGLNLATIDSQIDRYERRLSKARGRLMDGVAMGAMALAPVVKLGKFEHQLVHFGNIANKTRDELTAIEEDLRSKSQKVNQSATDMLSGIDYLMGKGLGELDASGSIEHAGKAATATGASINDMARASFAVIDNLKVKVEELPRVLDIMAQAGKRGGFELRDMAGHFPKLTANARTLGMEGAEATARLSAALQIAMKGAGSPEEAANNLNNFMSKLASPETVRKFKKMGIDIRAELDNAAKEGLDPMEYMLVRMHDLAEENPWVIGDLFGDMQVLQFLKPLIANLEEYADIRDDALNASGVIDADFQRVMDTNVEKWKAFVIQLDKALTSGKGFANTVKSVVTNLTSMVGAMNDFAAAHPEMANGIIHLVGGFLLLGMTLRVLSFLWAITGLGAWKLLRGLWALGAVKIAWNGIKPLKWASYISRLAWSAFIFPLKWSRFALKLAWSGLVEPFKWAAMIPKLRWSSVLGLGSKLSWRLLIKPLVWFGKFIPVIGWAFLAADLGLLAWELIIKPLEWDQYLNIENLKSIFGGAMDWLENRWLGIMSMFGQGPGAPDSPSVLPKWEEATPDNIEALKYELDLLQSEIADIRQGGQFPELTDNLARPKEQAAAELSAKISVLEQQQIGKSFDPIPNTAAPSFDQMKAFIQGSQPPQQVDKSKHVTQHNQYSVTVVGGPANTGNTALSSIKSANDRALADTD